MAPGRQPAEEACLVPIERQVADLVDDQHLGVGERLQLFL